MAECDESKEFLCNNLIIKALMQFLPFVERKKVQEWMKKLQEIDEGSGEAKTRNEYAFYLLTNVQRGTMSQPFNRAPPSGKLKPLCRILPDYLYEDVMKQIKLSYCRLNKMLKTEEEPVELPNLGCEPANFQCEQPRPRKGVIAHCAVFSKYPDGKNSK